MRDIIPAEDYLSLQKQFLALLRMYKTQEAMIKQYSDLYDGLLNEIRLARYAEVDSLRSENEMLTNLLEENGKRV